MKQSGIEKALEFYESSATALATAIGDGVLRQNVEHWIKSGQVPYDHCPKLERLTGIPCEELRPSGNWADLRALRNHQPAGVN